MEDHQVALNVELEDLRLTWRGLSPKNLLVSMYVHAWIDGPPDW